MGFTTVYEGRSAVDAQLIAIALEEDGIECRADDAMRWDDFAVAQRVMNLTEGKVMVKSEDAGRARATVARVLRERAERRAAGEVESLVAAPAAAPRRVHWAFVVILVVLLVALMLIGIGAFSLPGPRD